MTTPNRLLDLAPGLAQRAETFEFEIVNRNLERLGNIKPHREEPVGITNDGRARVTRSLSGMTLREADWRNLNPLADHLRTVMLLEDGTRWPLGVFIVNDDHEHPHSQESDLALEWFDFTAELDDGVPESVSLPAFAALRPALVALVEAAGIVHYEISPTDATVGTDMNWAAGTKRLDIIRKLCQVAGFLPPYFDNRGVLVIRPMPAVQAYQGHTYDLENSRIVPDTTEINRNLAKTPNAYLVIGTGGNAVEVSAIAYVDPHLPHSREKRGRTITDVSHEQGIATYDQALALAKTKAQTDPRQAKTVTFTSKADPRHDTYDLVQFIGEPYLEVAWSLTCQPGGDHTHSLVKRLDTSTV